MRYTVHALNVKLAPLGRPASLTVLRKVGLELLGETNNLVRPAVLDDGGSSSEGLRQDA